MFEFLFCSGIGLILLCVLLFMMTFAPLFIWMNLRDLNWRTEENFKVLKEIRDRLPAPKEIKFTQRG